ncbi:MAG: TIGR00282 family metallophosphoesterase [Brevinema sp.]
MLNIPNKKSEYLRVIAFGDITGAAGRSVIQELVPRIKEAWEADLIIANAENTSHGFGLTPKHAQELKSYGVDLMTMGNHVWDKQVLRYRIKDFNYIARPINMPRETPGTGVVLTSTRLGQFAVINALGRLFMQPSDCPFHAVYDQIKKLKASGISMIAVDFHAEATSEKLIMGRFLDGHASLVWGTHTHVPTADDMILPKGTGYISDLGLTGALHSILGFQIPLALKKMIYGEPYRNHTETVGERVSSGIVADICPKTGTTVFISKFSITLPALENLQEDPNTLTKEENNDEPE